MLLKIEMLLKARIFQTEFFQIFIYNFVQKQTFLVMNDKDLNSCVHHMMQNDRKIVNFFAKTVDDLGL